MNREAVALGTPVYTTFEGRLGAVDERLIAEGRLRKLREPRRSSTCASARRASAAARASAAIRACSSSCCCRRCGPNAPRASTALQSAQCADGSARRPFPSTVTHCRSSRWTGCWSRSRTTSPSSCASATARPATTRTCANARSGGCSAGACRCWSLARVYQRRWRYVGPARLRGGRPRGRRDRAADGRRGRRAAPGASALTAPRHRRRSACRTA